MTFSRDLLDIFSLLVLPALIVFFPLYGVFKRVPVYEKFVEGAKEGFKVGVMIIPYLVAIFVAIQMFKASGAMEYMEETLRPVLSLIGFPPEVVPMAIVRPLTGSGSTAVVADMVNEHGPDHIYTLIAATIFGSTETTFYVLAVYFGSVGIKKSRHALAAGLIADIAAIFLAVYIVQMMYGWAT